MLARVRRAAPARRGPVGVGLGLRWELVDDLVERLPASIDFLEIAPENYVGRGGRTTQALDRLAERYPILSHGLTLSLGGTDPLDAGYLRGVRELLERYRAPWHSDHLCFGAAHGRVLHDLLPLPYDEATAARVIERARRARDALGVPLAVENVSQYLLLGGGMSEVELVTRVCEGADCALMLDVNNVYVNATNFGFDAEAWIDAAPLDRVVQMHVAGHDRQSERLVVDTHGADVADPVLALLERAIERTGPVPVVLERDQRIPPLDALLEEVARVRAAYERGLRRHAGPDAELADER